jgi:LacI family transcriptional regulator
MAEQVKRATISDVARHAGVSKAAVSKVLRGAYGVSETMKSRVEASMASLDYRPSALARGMRGSSFTLGIFVVDLQNTFMSLLIEGIRAEAELSGYQVFIGEARRGLAQQRQMIEAMIDRKMDGLLLIAPFGTAEDIEDVGRATPTVVLGRHGPSLSYDTVASDDLAGSALIVDHLASLGHRRISHLKQVGREKNEAGMPQVVRAQGYIDAMVRNGLAEEIEVIEGRWSQEGGEHVADLVRARKKPPTAIHAGSDMAALGVLTGFYEAALKIPEDFSVVGYDNVMAAALPQVGLTTVDQSGVEMGSLAAKLLVERLQGRREAISTLVPPKLVVRKTTGPPRGQDL